jgi:MarR family transcriptional regulator, organic hydroperoxide resistance regulator
VDVLALLLTRLSRLNAVALEERAGSAGITSSEAVVLMTLEMSGEPLNPSRLQGLVIQSPGGLTKTIRRLEDAGYVRRLTDPDDRRALLVERTTKGRRATARVKAVVDEHYEDLFADLDDHDRRELASLVRRVLDRLEPATGMRTSGALEVHR